MVQTSSDKVNEQYVSLTILVYLAAVNAENTTVTGNKLGLIRMLQSAQGWKPLDDWMSKFNPL